MKKLMGIVVGLALLAGAARVNAFCYAQGKVQEIYTYGYSGTPYCYVYVAPTTYAFVTTLWYAYSYDVKVCTNIGSAQAGHNSIYVVGDNDSSSCAACTSGYCFLGQVYLTESFGAY